MTAPRVLYSGRDRRHGPEEEVCLAADADLGLILRQA